MVWIRLAEQRADDGEHGPHIDIDLCYVTGSGTFAPMEARANPCPGGATWGIWWHDGPDAVYANRGDSSPCELTLEVNEASLVGTFQCRGLATREGEPALDILDGSFRCTLEGDRIDRWFSEDDGSGQISSRGSSAEVSVTVTE